MNPEDMKEKMKDLGEDLLALIVSRLESFKGDLTLDLKKYAKPIADDIAYFAPLAAAGDSEGEQGIKHLMHQVSALVDIEGTEANEAAVAAFIAGAKLVVQTVVDTAILFLKK